MSGWSCCFCMRPIAVLIVFSFNDSKSRNTWTGFTLRWYEELFHDRVIIQSFVVMLVVAIASSVVATLLGTLAAIGLNKMNKKLKSVVMTFTYLPMINPEIITGVALMLLFIYLKMEFGMQTLIISHITFNVPYVILNVLPKLRQMDQNTYDAALDLGCNPFTAFTKVVIPEIMPGIVSGFLMALTYSMDDFVISYFVSGASIQTLPGGHLQHDPPPRLPEDQRPVHHHVRSGAAGAAGLQHSQQPQGKGGKPRGDPRTEGGALG